MTSQSLQSFMIPGGAYGYTGAPVDTLTSFENTLALGLLDESGSTDPFAKEMEAAVKEIIKSLRRSPRADNLIYRHCHFGSHFREHHGFMPLGQINESQYDGCYHPGGATSLYDSCDRVIKELTDYADQQAKQKYLCNGVIYVLTDGCDYGSTLTQTDVKKTLAKAIMSEALESLVTILIGVNVDVTTQEGAKIDKGLRDFQTVAGFTRYLPIGEANDKNLAKLANFVSQSISSQSQALGSGGPSQQIQSLTF